MISNELITKMILMVLIPFIFVVVITPYIMKIAEQVRWAWNIFGVFTWLYDIWYT